MPLVRESFRGVVDQVVERFAGVLRRAQARGEMRTDLEPGDVASLIVTLGFGGLGLEATRVPMDPEQQRDALLKLLRPPE